MGDGPAWLGTPYGPFDTSGNSRTNMNLQVALEKLADRRKLLKSFDTIDRHVDRTGLMNGLDSFEGQAFQLILGRAREVFDIQREDLRTRDRYGPGLGEQMLLARRLCEAGVGFVTLHYGGWDMHGDIANSMKNLAPQMDQAVSAFVDDCSIRGMDKDVLLVITGEFGRTPRINSGGGRDHWAPLSTLALAVMPVAVLTGRSDTMDSLMMALMVLAAWCVVRAVQSRRRELIVSREAVVLRRLPVRRDPPALLEAVQGRIEGPLLNLEHVFRLALDGLGYGVAVSRPRSQRPQDQQVERALQQFDPLRFLFGRHSRWMIVPLR